MNFKVLENGGTLTTSSEGTTINRLNSLGKTGIIKGRLNNLSITNTSSTITIDTGHLVIEGLNIILEESTYFTVAPTSSGVQEYLIVEIIATSEGITAELKVVNQYSRGNGLDFTQEIITGTLRCCLAYLWVSSSGILNVTQVIGFLDLGSDYVKKSSYEEDMYNSTVRHENGSFTYISHEPASDEPRITSVDFDNDHLFLEFTQTYEEEDSDNYSVSVDSSGVHMKYQKGENSNELIVNSSGIKYNGQNLDRHLYQHNIVIRDYSDVNAVENIASFSILSDDNTALTTESSIAGLLYARGLNSITNCLNASGRLSDDSFSYNYDDSNFETGYCESVVMGVFGNSNSELQIVGVNLNEGNTGRIFSTNEATRITDTVVQIF